MQIYPGFLYKRQYINCKGKIMDISKPLVMGILNFTPDSFYDGGRYNELSVAMHQAEKMIREGAAILDVGAQSSRPGARMLSYEEESERLYPLLEVLSKNFPDIPLSVDTFHARIAAQSVEKYGAAIINDISAGDFDPEMIDTIARLQVPYIIMHMQGTPTNMQQNPVYTDVAAEISLYLANKINTLTSKGINDIVIDPGFGFGKTPEHNFELLKKLSQFRIFELPILVGFSRKSMIYKTLDLTPSEALNGTTVLNVLALERGANILRVHDVAEAIQAIKLVNKTIGEWSS